MSQDVFKNSEHVQSTPIPDMSPMTNSDIPYELVPLPSEGKLYPEGHPLRGKTSVEIKGLTATEENILTSTALIKKGTVTKELVRSCLSTRDNKGIDQGTLLIGDKNAILFAIRISGFGPDYKVQTTCPECKTKFHHTFMLDAVKIKNLGEEAQQVSPGENLFEFILPSNVKVHFCFLTDKDDDDIREGQEKRKLALRKRGMTSDIETNVTDKLIKQIKSVNGKTDSTTIANFVKNLRARDARILRKHMNEIEPNLDMTEEVRCPDCGILTSHSIPITAEFFWPELD